MKRWSARRSMNLLGILKYGATRSRLDPVHGWGVFRRKYSPCIFVWRSGTRRDENNRTFFPHSRNPVVARGSVHGAGQMPGYGVSPDCRDHTTRSFDRGAWDGDPRRLRPVRLPFHEFRHRDKKIPRGLIPQNSSSPAQVPGSRNSVRADLPGISRISFDLDTVRCRLPDANLIAPRTDARNRPFRQRTRPNRNRGIVGTAFDDNTISGGNAIVFVHCDLPEPLSRRIRVTVVVRVSEHIYK